MLGISNLTAYIISVIIAILLPGPNSIFCLTIAAKNGIQKGYQAAAGVLTGDGILMLVSSLGAASVLKAHPSLFMILKSCGALYLSYLGITILIDCYKQLKNTQQVEQPPSSSTPKKIKSTYIKALTLSLMNPKAILFFLSFFVMFVDSTYPNPAVTFLALALILEVISFSYLTVLIFLGVSLTAWFSGHRTLKIMALTSVGILFIGFSATLLTANI